MKSPTHFVVELSNTLSKSSRSAATSPNTWEAREVGRQLLRSGMGVTGNYWSACRGRSDREFIAKLGVAADESEESLLWLTLLVNSGVTGSNDTQALLQEGKELRAILSKSHRTARENRQRRKQQKRRPRAGETPL
jgi:four helix bundle protein